MGHIGESAITIITVKDVLSPVGHKQIVEAVIVVVSHAHTTGPADFHQTRALCNIGKRAVPIVLEKMVAGAGWSVLKASAGKQKDVEPAVTVEINKGAAAAKGFENVFFAVALTVNSNASQASLRGDITEARIKGKAGWFASGLGRGLMGRNALTETGCGGGTQESGKKDSS